jgi:hypothetical protein
MLIVGTKVRCIDSAGTFGRLKHGYLYTVSKIIGLSHFHLAEDKSGMGWAQFRFIEEAQ